MEAAENTNDCIEPLVDDVVSEALEPNPELFISILGDVVWRELLLIHELLEGVIPCLLEHHLVGK